MERINYGKTILLFNVLIIALLVNLWDVLAVKESVELDIHGVRNLY